ncbi:G-patch domain-containing protein [Loa loa]|nr:G-patch domain-containing protein [Loa loa]EJD75745.1 G-patch domain-containing protein [Loa loa]
MAKEEEEEVKPSSSDAIIASLINEVRKTNEPFDMKSLIGGKLEVATKRGAESDGSLSSLRGYSKKLKRHRDKKSKKSKKSKYKSPSKSKSPSHKKKHQSHSRSTSIERQICHESIEKCITYTIPPSVEAVMEKISDDEDDLPVGADFLSVNASSSKMGGKSESFQDFSGGVQNRTKEFNVNEEVFPLAKKKKSESPPVLKKPRPLSEILAKVRAERDSTFVPRNIKLKQENGKSIGGSTSDMVSHTVPKSDGGRHDDVEYGPRPVEALGTQPISEDEDELQLSPLKIKQTKASKSIKIATISKVLFGGEKRGQRGKDGEIPVSDTSAGPSFSNDDTVDELVAEKNSRLERGMSGNESETRKKTDEKKRKKERKDKKHGKRYSKRSSSLSSDSEREWKLLGKKNKLKEHSRYSGRDFDKTRRRPGSFYVQSYYVDSNKKVHEGSKWQWNRGEKDVKEKTNALFMHTRSKGWRQIRSTRSPYPERKRKRSPSSSCSRSYSRTRSLSGSSSRSSHSSHYRKVRSSYRGHSHYYYHRDRENSYKRRIDDESNGHKIDKKKLLEIAQRNAAQMAQLGYLPNVETKAQLKTDGQSVDQLVDFCQKLQRSQDKAARREKGETVSSDEDLAPRKKKGEDDTDFLKHPFALKPATPITINIPNSIPIPIKTPAQRTLEESQLRITYPVSSGAQHREKDNGWMPVKKEEVVPSVCSLAQKTKLAALTKQKEKVFNTFEIVAAKSFVLPPPPPPPILASFTHSASSLLNLPPPPPPPDLFSDSCNASQNQEQNSSLGLNYGNVVTVPEEESVFREPKPLHHTPANVGRVMAKRIKASKLLAKDPNDYEARRLLKEADDQIRAWAESKKNLPGKFTGSTDVNVLKADQLGPDGPRFSVWAKKDFLKQTNAVNSSVGLKLMQKMGWTPGEGLGKGRDGPLEPLVLDIKSDRKGLVATEELPESKKLRSDSRKNLTGKHPVSVLMELCSKKRWHAPQFTCLESGPSNNRRFLWKAVVNGVEYQPSTPSTSKKTGKAQACQVVLQSLGLVPRDPSLPVVL